MRGACAAPSFMVACSCSPAPTVSAGDGVERGGLEEEVTRGQGGGGAREEWGGEREGSLCRSFFHGCVQLQPCNHLFCR